MFYQNVLQTLLAINHVVKQAVMRNPDFVLPTSKARVIYKPISLYVVFIQAMRILIAFAVERGN